MIYILVYIITGLLIVSIVDGLMSFINNRNIEIKDVPIALVMIVVWPIFLCGVIYLVIVYIVKDCFDYWKKSCESRDKQINEPVIDEEVYFRR